MPRQKQRTIDKLSIEQLTAKPVKYSIIVGRTRIPVILFKKTMDLYVGIAMANPVRLNKLLITPDQGQNMPIALTIPIT
jgi:hypothetical protein